ncbi:hypothetical protein AMS68_001604 [Peltaster fructicola]|uniref:Uncharacterized protein n=1 Tax=Peltaster fructicola TaxID=286661 RepID=A0A6H0XMW2_9PEZI|nr:hypothetical protein AMS68_001604 [Peltaster fructicola]
MAASQLRNLIYYHIDNDLFDTANFLAGRLHALDPKSPDAAHLLATTYLRLHRHKPAYDAAVKHGANGKHLGCAYVFALACLQLDKHLEGIQALERSKPIWHGKSNWAKHGESSRQHQPDAVAVQTLLAKLWHAHGDLKRAGEYYVEVHKASPFTWEAFDGLCKIGADLNMAHMFMPSQEMGMNSLVDTVSVNSATTSTIGHGAASNIFTPSHDPFQTSGSNPNVHMLGTFGIPPGRPKMSNANLPSGWDTPTTAGPGSLDDESVDDSRLTDAPQAPARRARDAHSSFGNVSVLPEKRQTAMATLKRTISGHTNSHSLSTTNSDPPSNPRRSNRLFGQATTAKGGNRSAADLALSLAGRGERDNRPTRTATGAKGRTESTVGRVVSGNRKIMPPDPADKEKDRLKRAPSRMSEKHATTVSAQPSVPSKQSGVVSAADEAAISELLDGLKRLAVGTYAASRFDLAQAVAAYHSLPASQRDTPWVLARLGKAYYEMADYRTAEECFIRLLKIQPSRIEDIEVYSTILWHLKKDTALALLCHSVREQHYDEPQTWCVVGNTFSLSREHDQAISSFQRATQLDPKFAYAWVLMGHEYIANEEYDAALYAFRKGVAADHRGFGGWYGLGKSLERLGKYEDAERHYRIAASINPSNATLLVCIGVVLEKLHNRKSALLQYSRALQLAPSSALARFKKARVLMHLRSFDQALVELEVLRDQAPDEANVWFLLGKCYKGLGDRGDALRAFTTALNLDAKASPFIREAMETLDEEYDDDDASEDE